MKHLLYVILLFLVSCNQTVEKSHVSKNEIPSENSHETLEIYDFSGIEKFLNFEDDKTYIVNFWATWCSPCIKELPYFEKIGAEYKTNGIEVVLISLDFPKHFETKLKPFLKKNNLQSHVIVLDDVDSNRWIPKVNEDWSGAIPATLIYNKHKRQFYEQSFTYNELETELKHFLN